MASRTPPEIKWLLVERATLVGDLAKLERRRVLLEAEIENHHKRIRAFDTTMWMMESLLQPDAAGAISRHLPGYGHRGALKDFILETVQDAEAGLSTREVGLRAAIKFALEFISPTEFSVFLKNTIRPALRDLLRVGKVECLPTGKGGKSLWRPRTGLPTFAELALLTGAVPTVPPRGATDGHQDSA